MKFVNLIGSENNDLGGSRIDYYINKVNDKWLEIKIKSGDEPCPVCKKNQAEEGAHIGKIDVDDRHVYLLPLCHECNESCKYMELPTDMELVRVPGNTEGFEEIRYPEKAVEIIKHMAKGKLDNWDGKPMK